MRTEVVLQKFIAVAEDSREGHNYQVEFRFLWTEHEVQAPLVDRILAPFDHQKVDADIIELGRRIFERAGQLTQEFQSLRLQRGDGVEVVYGQPVAKLT